MSGTLAEYIPLVTSQATLVGLPTTILAPNAVIKYVDSTTRSRAQWQIRSGGSGLHPSDYDATSNNKSWFQI